MSVEALPDVEAAVRAWLRAQPTITALVGSRSFVGIPAQDVTFPFLSLTRIGGGAQPHVPWDEPQVSIDCWAAPAAAGVKGYPNRPAAQVLAAAVAAAIRALNGPVAAGAGAWLIGGQVLGVAWAPDVGPPAIPRFVVTAQMYVRAA